VLASGSGAATVKLWDVASGRELHTLGGGHTNVTDFDVPSNVAFSPDGKMLALGGSGSGAPGGTVKLWDVASGRALRALSGHAVAVNSVAFSPDDTVLASGNNDGTVRLWDVATGRELRTLSGHTSGFNCGWGLKSIGFSPDGWTLASGSGERNLASGSADDTIKLWDVTTGRELRTLSGHSDAVDTVAFSPDGRMLASGAEDHTIKLWDVASGQELGSLSGHSSGVTSVAFSPDGKVLVSGGADGMTRVWDVSSGKERVALIGFTDGSSIAITPEGFFDSSSAQAEEYLNVRIGDRVFGIGSYREKYYRPDLVKLSLAGNSISGRGFADVGRVTLAPVVELIDLPPSTSEPKLTVNLHITDGGGGIGLVRLFVNGTAVVQDSASALPPSVGGPPIMRGYTVQLADGTNELRAVAFNADDSMWSSTPVATIVANLPPAPRGTLHAVAVGIQKFKNPQYNLSYSIADAQLFADTLEEYSAPLFQKVDVKLLTKPAETTRDSLMQTLRGMQSIVRIDDLFVFYAASHGDIVDGEYFLLSSYVDSVDRLKAEAVSNKDLTDLLANIPALKKLVIVDTCHAQALGNALQIAILTRGMNDGTATTILSRSLGLTVLAATKSDEEAQEGYKDHGLFAYVVAGGLQGHENADQNGIVSAFLLAHHVQKQVPKLALDLFKHDQHPTVNMNGEEFLLTKVK
jgi:WD40 domain-containing protein/caspase domain-containing protein